MSDLSDRTEFTGTILLNYMGETAAYRYEKIVRYKYKRYGLCIRGSARNDYSVNLGITNLRIYYSHRNKMLRNLFLIL